MSPQTPYAVISDVHANLPALEAVLADIDDRRIGPIICLGDVVGYGPWPIECADLCLTRCAVVLRGNHEVALADGGLGFNRRAREAIRWTRRALDAAADRGDARERDRVPALMSLPLWHRAGRDLFVHATPREPTEEYLMPEEAARPDSKKMREIWGAVTGRLFVGHTHLPMLARPDGAVHSPADLDGVWDGDPTSTDQRVIVNPGAVGQPRDHDPRASYVIVHGERIEWRRVPYEIERVVRRVASVPELDDALAHRLAAGV